MLEELRIVGLGVIEESVLELGPGFTAITGETGAGKTMVVSALGLLLGTLDGVRRPHPLLRPALGTGVLGGWTTFSTLTSETRDLLADVPVVFLRVGLSDAVKRVGIGVGRPLLLGNVRARIKGLLDERTPIYEEVATVVVETDGRTPEEVAAEVRAALEAEAS